MKRVVMMMPAMIDGALWTMRRIACSAAFARTNAIFIILLCSFRCMPTCHRTNLVTVQLCPVSSSGSVVTAHSSFGINYKYLDLKYLNLPTYLTFITAEK